MSLTLLLTSILFYDLGLAVMARDCYDEQFMWNNNDTANIINQLHEFRYQTSGQPLLQVQIPQRNVKGEE